MLLLSKSGDNSTKPKKRRRGGAMSLLEEFNNRYKESPTDPAKKILFRVLGDVFGRRGFDNAWDDIDDEIREELLAENLEIVKNNLP